MERIKKAVISDPLLKWKKVGAGSFRMPDRIIKPNEVFMAYEHEIPKAFRDIVICLSELDIEVATTEAKFIAAKYEVVIHSPGWYNVVNEEGKPINEKLLRKKEAEQLKKTLE